MLDFDNNKFVFSVRETSRVPSAAGKNGIILKMRKNNQQATVKLEGKGLSQVRTLM